jgi:hypothetical protein
MDIKSDGSIRFYDKKIYAEIFNRMKDILQKESKKPRGNGGDPIQYARAYGATSLMAKKPEASLFDQLKKSSGNGLCHFLAEVVQ